MSIQEFVDRMNLTALMSGRWRPMQNVYNVSGWQDEEGKALSEESPAIPFTPQSTPLSLTNLTTFLANVTTSLANVTDSVESGGSDIGDVKTAVLIAFGIVIVILLIAVSVYICHYRRIDHWAEEMRRPELPDPYAGVSREGRQPTMMVKVGSRDTQAVDIEMADLTPGPRRQHSAPRPTPVEMSVSTSGNPRHHSSSRSSCREMRDWNSGSQSHHCSSGRAEREARSVQTKTHGQSRDTSTRPSLPRRGQRAEQQRKVLNVQMAGQPFSQHVTAEQLKLLTLQSPGHRSPQSRACPK